MIFKPIESQTLPELVGKYVPPKRPGRPGYGDEGPAIRVSNISTAATQEDLQQLFEKFGRISRIHLGKYKSRAQLVRNIVKQKKSY